MCAEWSEMACRCLAGVAAMLSNIYVITLIFLSSHLFTTPRSWGGAKVAVTSRKVTTRSPSHVFDSEAREGSGNGLFRET